MGKINKVKRSEFSADGTILSFVGENGKRVSVPSEALPHLWQMARRAMAAASIEYKGDWSKMPIQEVRQISSGTTLDGKVALRLDPTSYQEICVSLPLPLALQLSDLLREQVQKIASARQTEN